MILWIIIASAVSLIVGILGFYVFSKAVKQRNIEANKDEAQVILNNAKKDAERIKIEGELKAKEIIEQKTAELEKNIKEKRKEFERIEQKLSNREVSIDRKYETIDRRESEVSRKDRDLANRENALDEKEKELDIIITQAKEKIEQIAGMSQDAAKNELVNMIENEARHEAAKRLKQIEEELNESAERKAKDIISLAIQKYAGEYTSDKTISVVNLPSDDMKGRIIGREGRNIRSIESRTGVDIIIDDTPETVVISSLNPIRREVARISLERLISDGRIHPARIEEIVSDVEELIEKEIQKAGEEAVFDLGLHNMHNELIKLVGKLKYRTSYSQNILAHSIEVAFICGILAGEVGYEMKLAKRAGLLHDIGKAVDHEIEGSHVEIGEDLVRKHGETTEVVEAVATYHNPNPNAGNIGSGCRCDICS